MAKIIVTEVVSGREKLEVFNFPTNVGAEAHFEGLTAILKNEDNGYLNVKLEATYAEFGISEEMSMRVRLELEE